MRKPIFIGLIALGGVISILGLYGLTGGTPDVVTFRDPITDPPTTHEWLQRADREIKDGKHADAIASLTRALELAPAALIPLQTRASVRTLIGDTDGALADYETMLEVEPGDPGILFVKGQVHYMRKEWSQAATSFGAARTAETGNEIAQIHTMWLAMSRLRNNEAISDIQVTEDEKKIWPGPVTAFLITGDSSHLDTLIPKMVEMGENGHAELCTTAFATFAFAQAKVPRDTLRNHLEGAERGLSYCDTSKPVEAAILRGEIEKVRAQ